MKKKALAATVVVLSLICGLSGCGGGSKAKSTSDSKDIENIMEGVEDVKEKVNYITSFAEEFSEAAEIGLEEQKKEQEAKAATAEEIENTYSEYVFSVFKRDGKIYKVEEGSEVQFYSDVTCTNEISTPRFLSETINDSAVAKNGLNPHSLLAENGTIVYCTESPSLVEVEAE